jgi:extradiol dioxygenase family protein
LPISPFGAQLAVSFDHAMKLTPFHIAIPVRDIAESRRFYGELIGCKEGRSDSTWVDFNLYGHQFVCHLNPNIGRDGKLESHYNPVDGHGVPVPHYGVVLEMDQWETLATRLKDHQVEFVIEPYIRFKGENGEQATLFFMDPSGNALEFKAFKDMSQLFAV